MIVSYQKILYSPLTFHSAHGENCSYGSYEQEFGYPFFSHLMFIVFKFHEYENGKSWNPWIWKWQSHENYEIDTRNPWNHEFENEDFWKSVSCMKCVNIIATYISIEPKTGYETEQCSYGSWIFNLSLIQLATCYPWTRDFSVWGALYYCGLCLFQKVCSPGILCRKLK